MEVGSRYMTAPMIRILVVSQSLVATVPSQEL